MKRLLITLLFWPLMLSSQTEEAYFILHVKGRIEQVGTGTLIKPKTKLLASDQLRFIDSDAIAAAISTTKGRFYIKKGEQDKNEKEWIGILKDIILPVSTRTSTRSGTLLNSQDLQKLFSNHFLITDNIKLEIPNSSFPQSEISFFYLQFLYNGEKVNKKLPYDNEWLIFDHKSILNVDGEPVHEDEVKDFFLYYYDKSKETSTLISSLNPVFVEKDVVLDVFNSVSHYYDSQEEREAEVRDVLHTLYGYITPLSFKQWLKENL